jgi:threonine/homoserine/homoserine lactone efflux protein
MLSQIQGPLSAFWAIFSFSFLVAMTGAMAPGPLLTYTIIQSAKARKRGYLTGLWIITGHALLEMLIIAFLLLGFSFVLKDRFVVRAIGVTGGVILAWFGASILWDVFQGRIPTDFLRSGGPERDRDEPWPERGGGKAGSTCSAGDKGEKRGLDNPVVGGFLVSMANPYWWVWWATIGFAFLVQFDITLKAWPRLLAFFLGHEAGDLVWYVVVSCLCFFGLQHLNRRAYYGILSVCALFMILFGLFLGVSPFFRQ